MNLKAVELQITPTKVVRFSDLMRLESADDLSCADDKKLILVNCDKEVEIFSPRLIEEIELSLENRPQLKFLTESITTFEDYEGMFKLVKEKLDQNEIGKIVLTIEEQGEIEGNVTEIAPFSSFDDRRFYKIYFDDFMFVGLSPDPFLDSYDFKTWRVHLVAGTCKEISKIPSLELVKSEEDISKSINPLGKRETVVDAGGLFHRHAVYEFEQKAGVFQFIREVYPPSTIFGSPYETVHEVKNKINPVQHPWGTLLGYSGKLSDQYCFRSIILIRGIFFSGKRYRIVAGSGLIKESNSKSEYYECINKINSVKKAFSGRHHG